MKRLSVVCLLVCGVVAATSCRKRTDLPDDAAAAPATRGSVHGQVKLIGPAPENDALRMAADPMCNSANEGRRVLDEAVVVAPGGALDNVFVELLGEFPDAPIPTEPVSIDQRGCVYRPRVVGMRAGQALQVRNSDNGLHNVHGVSTDRDSFNVSQPLSGMTNTFRPHDPGMLRLKCDVHTWMVAFAGVVNHPYFAVTGADGSFALRDVPTGTYSLRAWHERFGTIVSTIQIESNRETDMKITYDGQAAPAR
jgi:plastocyanin